MSKNTCLLIMLLLSTVSFSLALKRENSTCQVSDLEPGRLLSCSDENNIPVSVVSEVPSGSSCKMICPYKEVEAWVTCDDGLWNDYYIQYCKESIPTKRAHVIKKRGWRVRIRVRRFVRKIGCLFSRCKPRDTTAPSLICPPDQHVKAEKLQTWKRVYWAEPTANDGRDGAIKPTRNGKGPGSYFSGRNIIGYYARDKSGNMARCVFTVTVTVKRCPKHNPISNGYFQCHPSNDPRYGATCKFGCYRGFSLIGNTQLDCLYTESWNYPTPHCQKKTCPTLSPSVGNLNYSCTDGNKYRSICTYSCAKGYDITPGMSRVRVCTANGKWRSEEPTCIDIEPPEIQQCEPIVYAFADRNSTYGVATWKEPIAIDNHDKNVTVSKEGNISPGDRIPAGNYKVTYRARDKSGNNASVCTTNIIMKVLTCPTVYPTPFLSVTCPQGSKYGGQCEFNCDPGSIRNGSQIAVCEMSTIGNYGYWTWGDRQPFCQVIQNCKRKPNEPKNGAVACDYWLGGKFCQMLCKSGYDVSRGSHFYDMIVCGDSGEWLPAGALPLPDCAENRKAKRGILRMSVTYYFNGDCTDSAVQEEIKRKFIATLKYSNFKDACEIHATECRVENVQVKCGANGRKRSAELRLDFDVAAYFDSSNFSVSFAQLRRHQSDITDKLKDDKLSGSLDFNVTSSGIMEAQDIGNYDLVLDCPEKTVPSYKTVACVECAAGTYYDVTTETCPMCPRGTYQKLSGQDHCVKCPAGQTTEAIGGQLLSHCKPGCEPGSWSPDGTPECSLCPVGTYSDQYGSIQCTVCPGSTTTVEEGSTGLSKCQEFDLQLTDSNQVVSIEFDTEKNTNRFVVSVWTKYEQSVNNLDISLSAKNGAKILQITIGTTIRVSNYSRMIETSTQISTDKWHSVVLVVDGGSTELYIDSQKSGNTGLDFELPTNIVLGLKGKAIVSQLNIWNYNLTSLTAILAMAKKCFNNGHGDIFHWKAFENVSDDNTFKQIPSECDDTDACLTNPCQNGQCVDGRTGYSCDCYYGFHGDNCEENVDDCVDHACENNATCIDGAAEYTCQCGYGYKGELCETVMVDGSWGNWGEWSSCSVTCGNGTQQRARDCDDPAPDNGGLECLGKSIENRNCSQQECPECNMLDKLDHAIWVCSNDSGGINCTVDCEDGYEFDHDIKPFYYCGRETFYLWDFQTDDNPNGKTPYCSEIRPSTKMQISYTASYKDLQCDTSNLYSETNAKVPETVQRDLSKVNCIATGVCFLNNIAVTGCSRRTKRSAATTSAGFQVSLTCDSNVHGSEECYTALYMSVDDLQSLAWNDSFDTTVQGSVYKIDQASTDATSSVNCPTGSVSVKFYCVPCGPGRYFNKDECLKCDFGTYQDRSGQLSCKECPYDTTTPGRESRSSTECSVKLQTSKNDTVYISISILSALLLSVVIAMTVLFVRRQFCVSLRGKEMIIEAQKGFHLRQTKPTIEQREKIDTGKPTKSDTSLSVLDCPIVDGDIEVIYLKH
ncbi:uncharacterized protein LOC133182626 [Saccostrea echinata]|uniref:uncharacterized protein LOC133182626 n=1 Tax=Saccostrea echinata TaxID=191078 RepID=UPI002A837E31|nr:uncharacterized protein LOC133182626 [Saccostrea echinata]